MNLCRKLPTFARRLSNSLSTSVSMATVSSSGSYRAAVCTELGKPLQILPQQRKPLTSQEVRVSVLYGAVNFADILQVNGQYQVKAPTPFIPGSEFLGCVTEVGSDITHLEPGDHVVSFGAYGAYTEELVAEILFKVDKELSPQEGAALICSYGTAFVALSRRAKIQPGETVMVTAAAGALGLAIVDLAVNVFNAKVIGVCGGVEKCKLVKSYGAFETIDYSCESIRERVKTITGGKGVDIAADMVGGNILDDCLRSLTLDGRLLTLGYAGGEIPQISANLLLVKNVSVHGVFFGGYGAREPQIVLDSVQHVLQLWKQRKIRLHVGKVFPLEQVNEAFRYIASRQSTGKVLLDCSKRSML